MFSFITLNGSDRPLVSYWIVIELIGATTTRTERKIKAEHDTEWYPTGVKVIDADLSIKRAVNPNVSSRDGAAGR